jgi:hypothetical protein
LLSLLSVVYSIIYTLYTGLNSVFRKYVLIFCFCFFWGCQKCAVNLTILNGSPPCDIYGDRREAKVTKYKERGKIQPFTCLVRVSKNIHNLSLRLHGTGNLKKVPIILSDSKGERLETVVDLINHPENKIYFWYRKGTFILKILCGNDCAARTPFIII